MAETTFVYCPSCSQMVDMRFTVHICSKYREGVLVSKTRKRWNPSLSCFEVDEDSVEAEETGEVTKAVVKRELNRPRDEDVRTSGRFYDTKTNLWYKYDKEGRRVVDLEKREATFQTCEIPPKGEKGEKEKTHEKTCVCAECRPASIKSHHSECKCYQCWQWRSEKGIKETYTPYYTSWTPTKPFEGIDRVKWPNTFMFLLGFYYIGSAWYNGKTIPDADYKDRILHGKYAPEPKYPVYHNYYSEFEHGSD